MLLRQIGAELVGFSSHYMVLVGDGGVCGEGRLLEVWCRSVEDALP